MQNGSEKNGLNERINSFVQKNRTAIFVVIGVVVVAVAGFIISVSVFGAIRGKAISDMEALAERYETLRPAISAEVPAASESPADTTDAAPDDAADPSASDLETLLADLNTFAQKTRGYAGGRAWAMIASIHSEKKEWEQSETAWVSAAGTAKKTYLEPLAWFNAAAAAEEQNKSDEALAYYTSSLATDAAFPAAAVAQFSIGRLKEAGGDTAGAIEAYRALVSDFSYDTVWVNLAHSRIVALETAM